MVFLQTNLFSLTAQRHLATATAAIGRAFERLSSGLRINGPADDAPGLVIADRLARDVRLAAQAIRNANQGLGALSIADQALGTATDVLTRMSELASESGGLMADEERAALEAEFALLLAQLDGLAGATTFDGIALLVPGTTLAVQIGLDGSAASRVEFATVDGTLDGILGGQTGLSVATQAEAQAALDVLTTGIGNVTRARGALGAVQNRLLGAIDALRLARDTSAEAESRIRDADVAEEAANLARAQILQQAAVSVLAQANQQPSILLQLLR
jgi:flagellin